MKNYTPQQKGTGFKVWTPLLLSIFMVVGILIGMNLRTTPQVISLDDKATTSNPYGMGRVEEVLRYIENNYVDKVNSEELIEKTVNKLLDELDPHSNYIPKDELQGVKENLEGNFVGIGIEFDIVKDTILVLNPISGGPSEEKGILAGDKIIEISDSIVAGVGITTQGVGKILKGEKGSPVKIGIQRNGQEKLLYFEIVRDKIPLKSVDASFMMNAKTGYIKINRFSGNTYKEFMEAMSDFEEEEMEDLIIDLRQNPGGYLTEATRILNQIIPQRNVLLVYTEGEHNTKKEYETQGMVKFDIDDIVVLIDEGSASASEILAGALQDWDRAVIVGRRSFGKGLVQEQYSLSDGGALRLTVAKYFTKSGRLIQKPYDDLKKYNSDALDRASNGELKNADNIHITDSTKYYTSNGRVVYSGGGIIPDIFVPSNDIYENKTYTKLAALIPDFVYDYLNEERGNITEMGEKKFIKDFEVSDELFYSFAKYSIEKDKNLSLEQINAIQKEIKLRIKGSIARNTFGLNAYFSVQSQQDEMIQKTMEIIDQSKQYLEE